MAAVTGTDRVRFVGKHVLVIGASHSAANTLISLGQLAKNEPGTRISWAVRGSDASRLYGGGDLDGLPARGQLGSRLRGLVEDVPFNVDPLVPATGFRPDLDILREIRLDLDPIVEAPRDLGPMIYPTTGLIPDRAERSFNLSMDSLCCLSTITTASAARVSLTLRVCRRTINDSTNLATGAHERAPRATPLVTK